MRMPPPLLLLAALIPACRGREPQLPGAEPAVSVSLAPVHTEPLAILYRASGTVRGRSTVAVTSKVAGFVRAIAVRAGDTVAAGQVLVELEANDTRAGVSRTRAELARELAVRAEAASQLEAARAAEELARTSRDREARLFAAGASTRQTMDEAEARARGAQAQGAAAVARLAAADSAVAAARAAVSEGEATLGYTRVAAPFAGRVIERRVDPGAFATPATPLLVLDQAGALRVEAVVDESRGAAIRIGDLATVELASQAAAVAGAIGEIVPSIDVASRAFIVKIDLPASVRAIQPGTFARVAFAIGARPGLVVPTTTIARLGALDRVYVIDRGVARSRMIARGEDQGPWTEVLAGLSAGEQVAVDPSRLRDGARVEVTR